MRDAKKLLLVAAVIGAGALGWNLASSRQEPAAAPTLAQRFLTSGLDGARAVTIADESPIPAKVGEPLVILPLRLHDISDDSIAPRISELLIRRVDDSRFKLTEDDGSLGAKLEDLKVDVSSATSVFKLGRSLDVRYLVSAELSSFDGEYHLVAQLIDCKERKIEGFGAVSFASLKQAEEAVSRLAYQSRIGVKPTGTISNQKTRNPKNPNDLIDSVAPAADFSVKLSTGEKREVYVEGESISFVISVDVDCYVTLITRDAEGNFTLLLPNAWQQTSKVKKGQKITIPGDDATFRFPIKSPHGETIVKAIATLKPFSLRGVTAESLANQKFVDLGSNPRAISVEGVEDVADERPLSQRLKDGEWATAELVVVTRPPRNQRVEEEPVPTKEEPVVEEEPVNVVDAGKDPNEALRQIWRELTGGDVPILNFNQDNGGGSRSLNDEAAPAPDELIVFRRGARIGGVRNLSGAGSLLGGVEVVKLGDGSKSVVGDEELADKIAEIRKDPEVIAVIPNRKWKQQSKLPKFFPVQWGLDNRIKRGNDINWRNVQKISETVDLPLIGLVDQGMHYEDPRLANAIWTNPNEIAGNGVDDDKNGAIDDVHGWSFAQNNTAIFDTAEVFNHGTYCASIMAAKPVGIDRDMLGILPNAKIIPAVVFAPRYKWEDEPQATTLNILYGIDYCARMGAKVINLSLGGASSEAEMAEIAKLPMWDALEEAGVILVIAAGNQGMNIDEIQYFPAHIPKSNFLVVMATDPSGKPGQAYNPQTKEWSRFSNWGLNSAHIAAPGAMILGIPRQDQLALLDGTSFAAPMVAAACALLMGQHPDWTHHDVISAILETARKSSDLKGLCTTGGYLDLEAALKWKK